SSLTSPHPYLYLPLIIPPPPPSTLFPYTTLFRSRFDPVDKSAVRFRAPLRTAAPAFSKGMEILPWAWSKRSRASRRSSRASSVRDRKSTRLNSSHVSISYAVFCLKKKKITFIHCL